MTKTLPEYAQLVEAADLALLRSPEKFAYEESWPVLRAAYEAEKTERQRLSVELAQADEEIDKRQPTWAELENCHTEIGRLRKEISQLTNPLYDGSPTPWEFNLKNYRAVRELEVIGPWGKETAWVVFRGTEEVGRLFQGSAGYGRKVTGSLTRLVWSGRLPKGCTSPKSPHYGIHFGVGPRDTREEALEELAERAERLIAWRETLKDNPDQDFEL